jgi:hypothetical protein
MARVVAALALVAAVGVAGQTQNNPTGDDVFAALLICTTTQDTRAQTAEPTCEDVIELNHCITLANVDMSDDNNDCASADDCIQFDAKLQAEYALEKLRGKLEGTSCVTHEDTNWKGTADELDANAHIFAFDREIVDLFDINSQTNALHAVIATEAKVAEEFESVEEAWAQLESDTDGYRKGNRTEREEEAYRNKQGLMQDVRDMRTAATNATVTLSGVLDTTVADLTEKIEGDLAKLDETISGELDSYKEQPSWPNNTADTKWERNYEFVMAEKAPANTGNGHAGRWMYKIDFNPNNPGFWYPGGQELREGCAELSKDLKALDGIDRNLKPAADVDWNADDHSVRLQGSYLSNCGCGSRPRNRECIGMSRKFLSGAVMYNRDWNGCHYLRHDSRDCHHHWADCYARSGVQGKYTICTSASSNEKIWKAGPKGCGKNRCGQYAEH